MKILQSLFLVLGLVSFAMVGCEQHALEDTQVLHTGHGDHGDHGSHDDHAGHGDHKGDHAGDHAHDEKHEDSDHKEEKGH